ncbi:MAG TPA: hypothetical protein VKV80_00305 [Streptosporangiaceae bacterium]|nr:hypothetical protein [Streptosporangiaceae bacterium]
MLGTFTPPAGVRGNAATTGCVLAPWLAWLPHLPGHGVDAPAVVDYRPVAHFLG